AAESSRTEERLLRVCGCNPDTVALRSRGCLAMLLSKGKQWPSSRQRESFHC
ncbi:unnamed protein product, partial [Musa acuminata subsp. burmannicoides]